MSLLGTCWQLYTRGPETLLQDHPRAQADAKGLNNPPFGGEAFQSIRARRGAGEARDSPCREEEEEQEEQEKEREGRREEGEVEEEGENRLWPCPPCPVPASRDGPEQSRRPKRATAARTMLGRVQLPESGAPLGRGAGGWGRGLTSWLLVM